MEKRRSVFSTIVCAFMMLSGFLMLIAPETSAGSWTQTTYDDFNAGIKENVEVRGTGTGGYVVLGPDVPDYYPHISYYDSTYDSLKFAYQDAGGWNIETVDTGGAGDTGRYTSLALDDNGYPHISYYNVSATSLMYAYKDPGGWHIETVDNLGTVGTYSSLALDDNGYPHISYYDNTATMYDLKYAYKDAGGWHTEPVDDEGSNPTGLYTSIALDAGSRPHISYSVTEGMANSKLKYAYSPMPTVWSFENIDAVGPGDLASYTSLALYGGGTPYISYYYYGATGSLKLAKYVGTGGTGCDTSAWNCETVDSSGDVGQSSSLIFDVNDRPHISYFDVANSDLKYAVKDGTWNIDTVDSVGIVGQYTSIALDYSNNPHISYSDDDNGALKHAYHDGMSWSTEQVDSGIWGVGQYNSIGRVNPIPTATWMNRTPASSPPKRSDFGIAYDNQYNRAVLFGGVGEMGPLADTWAYDYSSNMWAQRFPAQSPPPRSGHAMAYDSNSNKIVLFGGLSGMEPTSETWEYDYTANTWTNFTALPKPEARSRHAMAYDSLNDRVILFGGMNATRVELGDTWAYNVGTHTWQQMTMSGPPARFSHAMAFDSLNNVAVMFGGTDSLVNLYADTWEFSYSGTGGTWALKSGLSSPSARSKHAMAYSSADDRIVMFGGEGDFGILSSPVTWIYSHSIPTGWKALPVYTTLSARKSHGIAYDSMFNAMVIFGGKDQFLSNLGDTWSLEPYGEYAPSGNLTSTVFNSGCSDVVWNELWWNKTPANQPPGTELKFQLATSTTPSPPSWNFVGWDGTAGTYYTSPGTAIDIGHDNEQYMKYKAYLSTSISTYSPVLEDITLGYNCPGNNIPILDWLGTGNYISDGLDPESGDTTTIFTYKIKYSDADNDAPTTIQLHIYDGGVDYGGSPFPMTFEAWADPGNPDYFHGAIYTYSTAPGFFVIGSDYTYCFEATDGLDWANIICEAGPTISGLPPAAPPNLWLEITDIDDITLHWGAVGGASEYIIYESANRLTAWPWLQLGISFTTSFTASLHATDGSPHYYIVRAFNGVESSNSTMGAKASFTFVPPMTPTLTDIDWFSLPFVSDYTKASDIANELGPSNISIVGKWNPARQRAITYTYIRGRWRGPDFDINPGEGIFVGGLLQIVDWAVVGTDNENTLNFNYYPRHARNINWISVPYTYKYGTASELVEDIEGGSGTANKIVEVGKWDPMTQRSTVYSWDGIGSWTGTDFTLEAGDGIYIQVVDNFSWPITLVTPTVP